MLITSCYTLIPGNVKAADPSQTGTLTISDDKEGVSGMTYYGSPLSKSHVNISVTVNILTIQDKGNSWLITYNSSGTLWYTTYIAQYHDQAYYNNNVSINSNLTLNGVAIPLSGSYDASTEWHYRYYNNSNCTLTIPKDNLKITLKYNYTAWFMADYLYFAPSFSDSVLNINSLPQCSITDNSTRNFDTDSVYLNGTLNKDKYCVTGKAWDIDAQPLIVKLIISYYDNQSSAVKSIEKSINLPISPTTQPSADNFSLAVDINNDTIGGSKFFENAYTCVVTVNDGYNTVVNNLNNVKVDKTAPTIKVDNTYLRNDQLLSISDNEQGPVYIAPKGYTSYEQLEADYYLKPSIIAKTNITTTGTVQVNVPQKYGHYKVYAFDRAKNMTCATNSTIAVERTAQITRSWLEGNEFKIEFDKALNSQLPDNDDFFIQDLDTKYNSNVYILADEDNLWLQEFYEDLENDPIYAKYYKYTQTEPNYYDNTNGIYLESGVVTNSAIETFHNVGKYELTYWVKDKPATTDTMVNDFNKNSRAVKQFFYVHRRPIARFNTLISNKVGSTVNLDFEDSSYDLDHTSRVDKGITVRKWNYKLQTSGTWIDGKPSSLIYNTGKYDIKLQVQDMEGAWSIPYIDTLDTANLPPVIDASPTDYNGSGPLNITITAGDNGENDLVLAESTVSPKTRYALTNSIAKPLSGWTDLPSKTYTLSPITSDGTYYLHMEAYDTAGQAFYRVRGPYTIESIKAGHFFITMMLDPGWRSYYFNLNNGIDDNKDGEIDRYPRFNDTDIGTIKMPINYFSLVGYSKTYIKAGYKVKGKIDINGDPDSASFNIHYLKEGKTCTDTVSLKKTEGETYTFEWIIPLETDDMSFISFDLVMKKGSSIYGNEKWVDTWDERNTSRIVFYVKGKATDDLIFIQSQ